MIYPITILNYIKKNHLSVAISNNTGECLLINNKKQLVKEVGRSQIQDLMKNGMIIEELSIKSNDSLKYYKAA